MIEVFRTAHMDEQAAQYTMFEMARFERMNIGLTPAVTLRRAG
jgi:hypothetical protein